MTAQVLPVLGLGHALGLGLGHSLWSGPVPPMSSLGGGADRVGDEGFDGSVFDAVGGGPFFLDLVDGFYAG